MKYTQMAKGIVSWLPMVQNVFSKKTGGTSSAQYCYSVWLRHLICLRDQDVWNDPKVVAELGPGDSIGIGLAALLSGVSQYYAFDLIHFASNRNNLKIFDELVALFKQRADVPGEDVFPKMKPYLDCYKFPSDILTKERLARTLAPERIEYLRSFITRTEDKGSPIQYMAPWTTSEVVEESSVDLIYSQAVLEHVEPLEEAYRVMRSWLKPTGLMSHQIDFKCHGVANEWNGHWAYSDWEWKMIRGRRPFLINRQPLSGHLKAMENAGFKTLFEKKVKTKSSLTSENLSKSFAQISSEDLMTSGAYMISIPAETYRSVAPPRLKTCSAVRN